MKPKVQLSGNDGNVFLLIGLCQKAARSAGWSVQQIEEFMAEAESDDYDHFLATAQRYFNVQ